ncbi:putative aminopeptidase W07G4.4 isoform X2 [Condylostylus longicornis]|uniref:putative aminopeptidase W07G4.4 isoform X2 n=1 Tax=Condylostylus longicornis TaxID=2530218 RepID=UPI00244E2BA5|nr:putative aminopeptidase W07G4.4 isoform X2 [Condylostylus longicornis]
MVINKLLPCKINIIKSISESNCDAYLCVDEQSSNSFSKTFNKYRLFDKAFDSEVSVLKDDDISMPVVYAPVGNLTDYHDVRVYQKAIGKAINRAIKAGFKNPALVLPSRKNERFPSLIYASVLGVLHELYVPIQFREAVPTSQERIESLSIIVENEEENKRVQQALLFESGKFVARDIGGGDPERMAPKNIESYIKPLFKDLEIEVISDVQVLQKEYPLFAAVNRAASMVDRHQGRIIFLKYKASKTASKSLLLVGKGVTYDTGGADIKAGGVMAGMSRDKCGAAAVAGFMQVVQEMKPENVNVIAALCLVRNSVGEESYVSDEIITSRAGVRIRVGNTDAEGRMCMADALCRMKELAKNLPDPHLFTIATLTGHACIAAGSGYSIVIDNSVARKENHDQKLAFVGEEIGEPFEISKLRQDDFDFNAGKALGEDLLQCNNLPSSRTPRGHQVPAAFMIVAAGLDKHGLNSDKPLKYSHIDIAASSGDVPDTPTAVPLVALAKTHLC